MGNIDFTNNAGFSWYCLLLVASGVTMLFLGTLPRQTKGGRVANLVFGAGFTGYGLYLIFLFHGVTYFIFFKAFILPVLLVVNTVKAMAAKRDLKKAPQRRRTAEAALVAEQQAHQAWLARNQAREAAKAPAADASAPAPMNATAETV